MKPGVGSPQEPNPLCAAAGSCLEQTPLSLPRVTGRISPGPGRVRHRSGRRGRVTRGVRPGSPNTSIYFSGELRNKLRALRAAAASRAGCLAPSFQIDIQSTVMCLRARAGLSRAVQRQAWSLYKQVSCALCSEPMRTKSMLTCSTLVGCVSVLQGEVERIGLHSTKFAEHHSEAGVGGGLDNAHTAFQQWCGCPSLEKAARSRHGSLACQGFGQLQSSTAAAMRKRRCHCAVASVRKGVPTFKCEHLPSGAGS